MIIYGTGEKKLKTDQLTKVECPSCGKETIQFHFFAKYIHIFWIPIFPIGRRSVAHCEECNVAYEHKSIPLEIEHYYSDAKSTARTPFYLFSGLALIIIGLLAIKYVSEGPKTYKYPSGNKEARGKMIKDEMVGKWIFWHENGKESTVQYYIKGKPDSIWTWWREDGSIEKIGGYKDGLYDGKWTFYYPNGELESEEYYSLNRLKGMASYYFDNGSMSAKGNYVLDKHDGVWEYWDSAGQKTDSGAFSMNEKIGEWVSYYENGKMKLRVTYTNSGFAFNDYWTKDGVQVIKDGDGVFTSFYEGGQMESQGKVNHGNYVGQWNYWYENGNKKESGIYDNATYKLTKSWNENGVQLVNNGNGDYTSHFSNGVISAEGNYKNGLTDGDWLYRNEQDIITSKLSYTNGKIDGAGSYYYDSGEIYSQGNFIDGKQDSLWIWYFEDGNKSSEVEFANGAKSGVQTFWNELGRMIKKEFYEEGEFLSEEVY